MLPAQIERGRAATEGGKGEGLFRLPPPSDEGREEIQKEEGEEKGGETDLFSIQITDPGSFSSSILSSRL